MADSSLPQPSPRSLPRHLDTTRRRRLVIALAFVVVSVFRWDRDLAAPTTSAAVYANATSRPSPASLPVATVAYAVSITRCSPKLSGRLFDAGAVLRRSIQLNSWPMHPESRYAAKFYAFTLRPADGSAPEITDRCFQVLEKAGWEVLPQDPPLYPELIEEPDGSALKTNIGGDGCCGHNELIKLNTYKLTDHEMALHLDLDTLVTHPLDELWDVMYFKSDTDEGRRAREALAEVVAPTYVNRRATGDPSKSGGQTAVELLRNITVDAYFTKDYNMIIPGQQSQRVGVQGGFLAVRPSFESYAHLVGLVYSGEFYGGFDARTSGWFHSGYGKHIWGSMTIQGLMAYYFDVERLDRSVELNRCRYNNIADNARTSSFAKNPKFPRGTLLPFVRDPNNERYNFDDRHCRDGRGECDDTNCQRFPLRKARVLHYTYCKNPWRCIGCEYLETYKEPACYEMAREWFRVRSTIPGEGNRTLDRVQGDDKGPLSFIREDGEVELREGNCYKEFFLGYCMEFGKYDPMIQRKLS